MKIYGERYVIEIEYDEREKLRKNFREEGAKFFQPILEQLKEKSPAEYYQIIMQWLDVNPTSPRTELVDFLHKHQDALIAHYVQKIDMSKAHVQSQYSDGATREQLLPTFFAHEVHAFLEVVAHPEKQNAAWVLEYGVSYGSDPVSLVEKFISPIYDDPLLSAIFKALSFKVQQSFDDSCRARILSALGSKQDSLRQAEFVAQLSAGSKESLQQWTRELTFFQQAAYTTLEYLQSGEKSITSFIDSQDDSKKSSYQALVIRINGGSISVYDLTAENQALFISLQAMLRELGHKSWIKYFFDEWFEFLKDEKNKENKTCVGKLNDLMAYSVSFLTDEFLRNQLNQGDDLLKNSPYLVKRILLAALLMPRDQLITVFHAFLSPVIKFIRDNGYHSGPNIYSDFLLQQLEFRCATAELTLENTLVLLLELHHHNIDQFISILRQVPQGSILVLVERLMQTQPEKLKEMIYTGNQLGVFLYFLPGEYQVFTEERADDSAREKQPTFMEKYLNDPAYWQRIIASSAFDEECITHHCSRNLRDAVVYSCNQIAVFDKTCFFGSWIKPWIKSYLQPTKEYWQKLMAQAVVYPANKTFFYILSKFPASEQMDFIEQALLTAVERSLPSLLQQSQDGSGLICNFLSALAAENRWEFFKKYFNHPEDLQPLINTYGQFMNIVALLPQDHFVECIEMLGWEYICNQIKKIGQFCGMLLHFPNQESRVTYLQRSPANIRTLLMSGTSADIPHDVCENVELYISLLYCFPENERMQMLKQHAEPLYRHGYFRRSKRKIRLVCKIETNAQLRLLLSLLPKVEYMNFCNTYFVHSRVAHKYFVCTVLTELVTTSRDLVSFLQDCFSPAEQKVMFNQFFYDIPYLQKLALKGDELWFILQLVPGAQPEQVAFLRAMSLSVGEFCAVVKKFPEDRWLDLFKAYFGSSQLRIDCKWLPFARSENLCLVLDCLSSSKNRLEFLAACLNPTEVILIINSYGANPTTGSYKKLCDILERFPEPADSKQFIETCLKVNGETVIGDYFFPSIIIRDELGGKSLSWIWQYFPEVLRGKFINKYFYDKDFLTTFVIDETKLRDVLQCLPKTEWLHFLNDLWTQYPRQSFVQPVLDGAIRELIEDEKKSVTTYVLSYFATYIGTDADAGFVAHVIVLCEQSLSLMWHKFPGELRDKFTTKYFYDKDFLTEFVARGEKPGERLYEILQCLPVTERMSALNKLCECHAKILLTAVDQLMHKIVEEGRGAEYMFTGLSLDTGVGFVITLLKQCPEENRLRLIPFDAKCLQTIINQKCDQLLRLLPLFPENDRIEFMRLYLSPASVLRGMIKPTDLAKVLPLFPNPNPSSSMRKQFFDLLQPTQRWWDGVEKNGISAASSRFLSGAATASKVDMSSSVTPGSPS